MRLEELQVGEIYQWSTFPTRYRVVKLYPKAIQGEGIYTHLWFVGEFERIDGRKVSPDVHLTLEDMARLKSLDEVFYE